MIGGWEFVQAAYAIAYGSLGIYGVLSVLRARRVFAASAKKVPL